MLHVNLRADVSVCFISWLADLVFEFVVFVIQVSGF
jgi:hypothetical protein